mmetsp:Transcript_75600/g.215099  ORF Transcript_75600/g.215099 Transcript_75600/m.215099 type:complete len:235 (+) Transcript_75600:890-1594(+)
MTLTLTSARPFLMTAPPLPSTTRSFPLEACGSLPGWSSNTRLSFSGTSAPPVFRLALSSCRKTCRLNESFTNLESSSPRSFTARWSGAWRCFFLSGSDMVLFVGWRLVGCVRKLLFSWRAVKNRAVAASEWGERLVVAERSDGAARAAARARSGGKVGPRAHALVSGMQVLESAVGLGRVVPSRDPTFRSARTRREPGPPLTLEASSGAFWERCNNISTGGRSPIECPRKLKCG